MAGAGLPGRDGLYQSSLRKHRGVSRWSGSKTSASPEAFIVVSLLRRLGVLLSLRVAWIRFQHLLKVMSCKRAGPSQFFLALFSFYTACFLAGSPRLEPLKSP